MEPNSARQELEKFLQQFLEDNNNLYFDYLSANHLLELENIDRCVQGDSHPEIYDLIMNTYHKLEREKKQK